MAEGAKSPGVQSRRHSRRSTGGNINFSQMSLSPLTSTSITEDDFKRKNDGRRSSSYIQGASAPTTPGILSRSPSFSRSRGSYIELPKSKSSSQLLERSSSSEWMHRTGVALTSEARESKGQSWLVSRASSTSLVNDGEKELYAADDEFSPATPRKLYLRRDSFSGDMELTEDDFENSIEDEDDAIYDLPRGFGLGQFIDRLIGWSLFASDDDEEDQSFDEYQARKRNVREGYQVVEGLEEKQLREQRRERDEEVGWQDPAWIFSIASNVLF
ncbi:hypothetical protein RUND412_009227 [Rhizina undulata]